LKDFELITGFSDIEEIVKGITIKSADDFLYEINKCFDWLKNNTSEIGNAQRAYLQYFFREIFNPDGESFRKPEIAVTASLHKYQIQNM